MMHSLLPLDLKEQVTANYLIAATAINTAHFVIYTFIY